MNIRPIQSEESSLTRLQRGMVVQLFNSEHVVTRVNDCRALCLPIAPKKVDYAVQEYDPKTGTEKLKRVSFETFGTPHGISPDSEIPILRRMTETQLLAMNIKPDKIVC